MPRLLHSSKPLPKQRTSGSQKREVELQETKKVPKVLTAQREERNIHTFRTNALDQKEAQLANSSAVMQQIHIISSDDEEDVDAEQSILSGQRRGFPGFSSPRNNASAMTNMTPNSRQSKTFILKDSSSGGGVLELGKRSSYDSQLSVDGTDINEQVVIIPSKRKKEPHKLQKEDVRVTPPAEFIMFKSTTPAAEQVVEVNSNSTTYSQRQKRLQRRCAQNSNIQQFNNTKGSTETSSEFPVSSPSNAYTIGISNKFLQRHPLLKNTLPSDSFERQLAAVTACNPQMTLAEKIRAWKCDTELSDVEDVNEFDALFQRNEDGKRRSLRSKKNKLEVKENEYDFSYFRNVILKNVKSQKNKAKQLDERAKPSTSAAAAASQLRRQEKKTRPQKEQKKKKKTQSSTTPGPASSSSSPSTQASAGNQPAGDFYALHKNKAPQNPFKLHVHEKLLCPSSSSEGDPSAAVNLKPEAIVRSEKEATPQQPVTKVLLNPPKSGNIHWTTAKEDSVFRVNRMSREIDKNTKKNASNNKKPKRLIEMHLDFNAEKKDLNLSQKKREIFKTPFVPDKRVPRSPENTLVNDNKVIYQESISSNVALFSESGDDDIAEQEQLSAPPPQQPPVQPPKHLHQQHEGLNKPHEGLHQQHEFCNYLGLTGMSTANAVATAVAELASSKIARRSLRVRRQQHEQAKSLKACQQLAALKMKQLGEIKRREKSLNYGFKQFDTKPEKSESASDSFPEIESASSNQILMENIKKLAEAPSAVQQKPEIKIVCHITADNKSQEINLKNKCIKFITEPIRKTLIEELRKGSIVNGDVPVIGEKPDQELKSADEDHDLMNDKAEPKERVIAASSPPTRFDNQTHVKMEHNQRKLYVQRSSSTHSDDVDAAAKAEMELGNTQQMLHIKFQEYLKASRRTKPTIFIVQSIDSDKEKTLKNLTADSVLAAAADSAISVISNPEDTNTQGSTEAHIIEDLLPPLAGPVTMEAEQKINLEPCATADHHDALLKRKNKMRLGKLLTRSGLNTTARQLRNRKIVILKTVKRKTLKVRNNERKKLKKNSWNSETNGKRSNHLLNVQGKKRTSTSSSRKKAKVFNENKNTTRSSAGESPVEDVDKSADVSPVERAVESRIPYLVESPTVIAAVFTMAESFIESAGAQHLNTLYEKQQPLLSSVSKAAEHELVVVSSTTNCYDEQATKECSNTNNLDEVPSMRTFVIDNNNPVYTKDNGTQSVPKPSNGIYQLTPPSSPLKNPLKSADGKVLYIYYELDVLIVVQEMLVSFWKYSKLLNILNLQTITEMSQHQTKKQHISNQSDEAESSSPALDSSAEWLHLGEFKRLQNDYEINSPYANRICVHNSIPIYVEMRCKELEKQRRDCNLLSLYINVYYYNDEEMHAKMHSIQLDSVQSFPTSVIYTTITDSRYFVMSWPQENILGKMRSGLCKYSLTPHLDTLASIREFKSMRHEVSYLECTDDDKLVGFGATQVTIWDHRSGDVLMNYDLDINIGRNLGSIYYPCLEIGQNSMMVLFQYTSHANEVVANNIVHDVGDVEDVGTASVDSDAVGAADAAGAAGGAGGQAEVQVIACNISHVSPSHRVLLRQPLPSPAFTRLANAINTGEHMLLTASNDEEIWINCSDPKLMTFVPAQNSQRFYVRGRSQIIELTDHSLTVNCFATHVLKIATTSPGSISNLAPGT